MQKISYQSLLAKLIVAVALAALAYIVCLAPTVTHAQTNTGLKGNDIIVTTKDASFYETIGGRVRFTVVKGTLGEILGFTQAEMVNGKNWYKIRVADGYYGYVVEDSIAKFTGTIPNIFLWIDYQASTVHLNYEARKRDYDMVINQGVVYINPNSDLVKGNDTTQPQPQPQPQPEPEPEPQPEEEDEDTEDNDADFKGNDIIVTSINATFYQSAGGARKFTVARGTVGEILGFTQAEMVNGKNWYKIRVADGNYGYVPEESIDHITGTVPTIFRWIDYQASQVHLNYEARKRNPDIVINQGVVYINPNDDSIENNDTTQAEEDDTEEEDVVEEEDDTEEDVVEEEDIDQNNRDLMLQIIELLKQLLNLRLQYMQLMQQQS
ncbi:MAG: hypothetical protein V4606_04100 [Patescibacteria group bacterium]